MFLMIENETVSPIECFTMLGLSTSRGTDKVGQYGSGFKHGVLTLLRNNINPYIYLGDKELAFYTMPAQIPGKQYNEVHYIFDGRKEKLSYCLEFGELDWTSTEMAIREIISNAIDVGNYNISVEPNKEGREGYTRVYIPWSSEIQKYVSELKWRFLHLDNQQNNPLIKKSDNSPAKIYRRGVYVRQIDCKYTSLFDYNSDTLKIDECRNLNDWDATYAVRKIVEKSEVALTRIFEAFRDEQRCWEEELYHLEGDNEVWQNTWKKVCGNAIPCGTELAEKIKKKGYTPIICNYYWLENLRKNGIKTDVQVLTNVEKNLELVDTRQDTVEAVRKYWKILQQLHMTNGKKIPKIANFSGQMNAGSNIYGFYEDGTVYISIDQPTDSNTILEELAHYVTGATDESRDFQEYAFKLAARAIDKKVIRIQAV